MAQVSNGTKGKKNPMMLFNSALKSIHKIRGFRLGGQKYSDLVPHPTVIWAKKKTRKRWYGADHPMWPLRKAPKTTCVVLYIGPTHLVLLDVKPSCV